MMKKLFVIIVYITQLLLISLILRSLASFSSHNEWFVNTTYVIHLLLSVIIFSIFMVKIGGEDKSYKTPIYLSLFTVISTLPMAIIQNKAMISEGYGEVEYDNTGGHLDGEPSIWTHSLDFDPTNILFIISIILSIILISFWHKYKDEFKWLS